MVPWRSRSATPAWVSRRRIRTPSSRSSNRLGRRPRRSKAPGLAWPCRGSSSNCMADGSGSRVRWGRVRRLRSRFRCALASDVRFVASGDSVLAGESRDTDPRRVTRPPLTFAARPSHHPGMDRRRFLLMSLAGALAAPLAAEAQKGGKVWRIGLLETSTRTLNAANVEAFQQTLRQLGYIEAQNYTIEYRSADGDPTRFPDLAG